MIKQLTLSSCLLLSIALKAQEDHFKRTNNPSQRYWVLGIGSSTQSMYDEAISHVRYENSGMGISFSLLKSNEKKFREFRIEPTFVKLKTKLSNDLRPMEVSTTRIAANYQYLKKINWDNPKIKLWVGGDASLLFNFKRALQLDNSQLVYDYALSIGPAGKLEKQLRWHKRNCILSYSLSVPVISHIARPYYLNRIEFIDPKNDFIGDLLNNSNLVTFNKYIRVTSGASVTYPLFNHNALRIGYKWDFYKMHTINNVYATEHLVSIAFMSNY